MLIRGYAMPEALVSHLSSETAMDLVVWGESGLGEALITASRIRRMDLTRLSWMTSLQESRSF